MKRGRGKKAIQKQKALSDDKILFIACVAVFVFLFISLAVVNVSQNATITGYQVEGEAPTFIKNLFTNFPAALDENIAKYVLMFTLFTFILGFLNLLNFPPSKKPGKGSFLRVLAAIGISFLSVAYLIPENVFTIIMSFETFALMLMVLPLAALVLISAMLMSVERTADLTAGRVVMEILLWAAWCGFLLFRLITAWIDKGFMFLLKGGGLVLAAIFIASFIIFVANKPFREKLRKIGLEVIHARAEAERAHLEEGKKTLRGMSGGEGI